MKYFAPLSMAAFAVVMAASSGSAQDVEPWPERYYNPAATEGDLILPMPCGGAMAFRPVQTPNTDGLVGDVRVLLGQEGETTPYLNGLRRAYVSGGFQSSDDSPKGLFYLGKYEVAEAQWTVIMDGCPEKTLRKRAFAPITEKSPLEMAQFAERYTLWLMNEAPESLPQAEDATGFLRLPTEDEWEFAARGGLAVSDADFRAPRAPIPDGTDIGEFVAHGGTDSAGGNVQVIGTLRPNPLGLHDMLGNVAEVVDTPFSLVRHGRLHGQAGGIVKRGGDARSSLSTVTSATRFEVPPYNLRNKAPFADRYTGLRLAIAGLAITSARSGDQMMGDLERLERGDTPVVSSENEVDAILTQLEDQLDTPRGQQQLAVVRDTIAASRAERNAQHDRSIRLVMESGTHICDQIVGRLRNADFVRGQLQEIDAIEQEARLSGDQQTLSEVPIVRAETEFKLDEILANLDRDLGDYGEIIEGLASDNSLPHLMRQSSFIAPDVEKGGARRAACLIALEDSLTDRYARGFTDFDWVEARLSEIAAAEIQ